jgi:hypothetical protein
MHPFAVSGLCLLFVGTLVEPAAHSAVGGASSAESLQASETGQGEELKSAAGNAKHLPASEDSSIKAHQTTTSGSNAARNARLTALHGTKVIPRRPGGPTAIAGARLSNRTVGAPSEGHIRSGPTLAAKSSALAKGGEYRAGRASASPTVSRPSLRASSTANRPKSPQALAGSGAVGGPFALVGATVGGPATGNTMAKGGINGTALRRKF